MSTLYYLAYGSNLHPHRLKVRIPSSHFLGTVNLPGYKIEFHKRGACGSGKCNLLPDSNPAAVAFAAIYEMAEGERSLLDAFEGEGYEARTINVLHGGEPLSAFVYLALDSHIDEGLSPYHWYKDLVYYGAQYQGFPTAYLSAIKGVASIDDPDSDRDNAHQELLREIRSYES